MIFIINSKAFVQQTSLPASFYGTLFPQDSRQRRYSVIYDSGSVPDRPRMPARMLSAHPHRACGFNRFQAAEGRFQTEWLQISNRIGGPQIFDFNLTYSVYKVIFAEVNFCTNPSTNFLYQ